MGFNNIELATDVIPSDECKHPDDQVKWVDSFEDASIQKEEKLCFCKMCRSWVRPISYIRLGEEI